MENLLDTIAAISTGTAGGAISIVRLSGDKAIEIADKMFVGTNGKLPSTQKPRVLKLGKLVADSFTEQAMCVIFCAPNSYTGQNMVEFQCHGGIKIATGVLKKCLSLGARLATNGEFTRRAVINGKMSLSAAEGMMDMINAESDAEIRAGYGLLTGKLAQVATAAEHELVDLLSEIEVSFDYPEETIEYITKNKLRERLTALSSTLADVLKTAAAGKIISSGINVLIVGKPNVGKSSLLNALLARERALVTDVPGTTRDIVEGSLSLGGVKVNFIDTAGIRETQDKVESLGVEKAKSLVDSADIILYVTDVSGSISAEDKEIFDLVCRKNFIHVASKADKIPKSGSQKAIHAHQQSLFGERAPNYTSVIISTQSGEGLEQLKQEIIKRFDSPTLSGDGLVITNERHRQALQTALDCINSALSSLELCTLDLVSIDLKLAYSAIGEITGSTTTEDIIEAIFSKFCLGK